MCRLLLARPGTGRRRKKHELADLLYPYYTVGAGHPGERLMSIDRRMPAKRREILRIAATHGACTVCAFGSVAPGESGPDSDVDFLLAVHP
jgi:hypothetical protein